MDPPCGLLGLPVEMITLICSHLCMHCHPTDESLRDGLSSTAEERLWASTKALVRMSQTCQTLAHIAHPFLYHCPHPGRGKGPDFVRHLFRHSHLQPLVKHLYLTHDVWHTYEKETASPGALFSQSLLWMIPLVRQSSSVQWPPSPTMKAAITATEPISPSCEAVTKLNDGAVSSLTNEASSISLTPNLERLLVELKHRKYLPWVWPNADLPHLKELVYRTCKHSKDDTFVLPLDMGGDLVHQLQPAHLRVPRSLIASMASSMVHGGVTELCLGFTVMSGSSLRQLMSDMRRLRTFSWSYAPQHPGIPDKDIASIDDVFDALALRRDTLNNLELGFYRDACLDFSRDGSLASCLRRMCALRTLVIHGEADEHAAAREDGQMLVDWLPQSIRAVDFAVLTPTSGTLNKELMQLAANVTEVPGKYPHWKKVRLPHVTVEERGELAKEFSKGGIEIVQRVLSPFV